jgi:hypothetical protein
MYFIGTALSQRSNADGSNGWTSPQAIAILYYIALNGEYVATDVIFPLELLTADEINAACLRLEEEEFNCYWCGVKLTFTQESGYNQFSPDRLFDMQYFEPGQKTVRSCTHCQFFFHKASLAERKTLIDDILSDRYNPDLADKALDFYDKSDDVARREGIERSSSYR